MITTVPQDFVVQDGVTFPVVYLVERSTTAAGTVYYAHIHESVEAHFYGPPEEGVVRLNFWYPRPVEDFESPSVREGVIADEMKALAEQYIEVALYDGDNLFADPKENVRFFVDRKRPAPEPTLETKARTRGRLLKPKN